MPLTPVRITNSLIKRLFFLALPFTLLAGLLYAGIIVYIETQTLKSNQHDQVVSQIKQLAQVIAIPTWNLDQQFVSSYLNQYAQNPYIVCIELISDANLQERAPENCQHPDNDGNLHSEPIIFEGQYIGLVISSFNVELDNERLEFILLSRIPVALVALISIFLVFFFVFRRWVVRPISAIMESIDTFQNQGIHTPVDWNSDDEIGKLVATFNTAQEQQMEHEQVLTKAKEAAEQALNHLKEAQSQLVESEKMASLGSLVAGISHEINTPLGVARTSSSHVQDALIKLEKTFNEGALTKNDMQSFIEISKDGLNLMTSNLMRANELMTSFKQVSADQSHDEIRPFNLYEYLQETLYTLKPNLKRYNISVVVDCDKQFVISSLPGAFSQIITNLIMNSLNHAYEPEDQGSIHIQVINHDDNFTLIYQDDGKGMSDDTRKRIFDPFFTTKRGSGGTGLGMHIIYNLITHKLHGTIEVKSQIDNGCQFTMKLPNNIEN